MSDEQLKRAIHQIAKQEISDDMNRWHEIYSALDLPKPRLIQRVSRMAAMVALVLVGLAVTGLTAYAVYQLTQEDVGLTAVEEAGLATEINQSQTIDGITVTIDSAFLDATRMILWMSISGSAYSGDSLMSFMAPKISYRDGGDFGQNGGSTTDYEKVGDVLYYVISLNHDEPIPADGVLPLRLDFIRTDYTTSGFPEDFENATQAQIDAANATEIHVQMPEGFRFDFDLPVLAPFRLEPMQTVESAGITMTLQELVISTSGTQAVLCHDNTLEGAWRLDTKLRLNDVEALNGAWGVMGDMNAFDAPILCWMVSYNVPYLEKGGTLDLTVGFVTSPSEGMAEIPEAGREWLASLGIEGAIEHGGGGWRTVIISKPDDMDEETAYKLIFEAITPRHAGEWVFRVELPE